MNGDGKQHAPQGAGGKKMDLRMCSHGVPNEFGPCEYCQETATSRASHDSTLAELGRVRAERDELETECKERVAEKMEWLTERNGMQKENAWLRSAIGDNAAAYQKGREDMREEAARVIDICRNNIVHNVADAIRAIPTEGREEKC